MKVLLYILCIYTFLSCNFSTKKQLKNVLPATDINKKELEKALNHYEKDCLKQKAILFLLENMPYHFSQKEYFISPTGEKYRPDITLFSGKEAMDAHCDSLIRKGYRINKQIVYDTSTIDSTFLVNNIELAFEVWQKPWARNVSFEDFCRFILPYRVQTEKISNLRREIMERFVPVLDSAKVKTPLGACRVLNEHLKAIMKYGNTGLPFYPTIDETYKSGISQCEGLCNLGTFIMRACGVPVTVEQTTWTKMDLGHNWCAVLDNGKFYAFGPGELQPGELVKSFAETHYLRPAKVYRSRFDPNLTAINKNDDGYITYLKSPLIYDVTDEYLGKAIQIKVSIDKYKGKREKSNQVYLRTYNHYEWLPIAIGQRKDSVCYFENVVGDNIFMVADSPEGTGLRNITVPFYVDREGNIRKFIPSKEHYQEITLKKREKKRNQPHTLHYWDTDKEMFIPVSYASATDTTQTYDNVPENALLWFTIPERIFNQRILFIENDSIKTY